MRLKLIVAGVLLISLAAIGIYALSSTRTKPIQEIASPDPSGVNTTAAATTSASSSGEQIDTRVRSLVAGIEDGLASEVDEQDAQASVRAAIDAIVTRSMAPQIERATTRSYIAQRDNSVITNMRRHHRTEGYFKDRPAQYGDLTPDEWVRFIDGATYEQLVDLYAINAPVIAAIDWSNTRVYTRAGGEPWIDCQRKVDAALASIGVTENNRSIGGGRSYYSPSGMAMNSFDPRDRPSVHIIVPMTTSTGEPLICAYEFVVNERGQLDPYQFMRGQRIEDDRGEPVPLLMPPF